MPVIIDGTPMNVLIARRAHRANKVSPASSDKYTPTPMPSGIPTMEAMPTRIAVPSSDGAIPPPDSPTAAGSLTRKLQLIAPIP